MDSHRLQARPAGPDLCRSASTDHPLSPGTGHHQHLRRCPATATLLPDLTRRGGNWRCLPSPFAYPSAQPTTITIIFSHVSRTPEDSVSSKLKTADGSLACCPVRSRLLVTPPAFAHHSRGARTTTVPSMAPNRHFCRSDTVTVMARSDTVTQPLASLSRGLRASLFMTAGFSMAFWLLLL